MAKNILIVVFIIVLIYLAYQIFFNQGKSETVKIKIKDQEFILEVAKTIPQKSKGLMNRDHLCQNCGMIFVSSFDIPQIFWMKNTLIPLDIIFVNSQGKVINIATATPEPGVTDTKLKLYQSDSPSKYVIELNAGTGKKIMLGPGDIINLSSI
jgi:uncharacterized membrane protein (UPF0127 family)